MEFTYKDYYTLRHEPGHKCIEHKFNIQAQGNCLIVNDKAMRVKRNDKYNYLLQKTQIQAYGEDPARKLITYMERIQDFAECKVLAVCEHVTKYGEEVEKCF